MRTFGGLPGVWRGGSHPKRWQTPAGTVPRAIGRGPGYPIRSIFRDNPPNVRRAYTVTWEICWPLIGQNIKMTNIVPLYKQQIIRKKTFTLIIYNCVAFEI